MRTRKVLALILAGGVGACGGGARGEQRALVASQASRDYVRSDEYARLVLEVDAVPGFEPLDHNRTALAARLAEIVDKPAGVEAVLDGLIASRGADHRWTFAELEALALETFDRVEPEGTTKMHVLFLDGAYDAPGGGVVLGVAWGQRHLAVFSQSVREACGDAGLPSPLDEELCADAELAVWLHEVGHVLGLVDIGLPMQTDHEDPEHDGHDRDADCVMYWAYEGDALVARLVDDLLGTGNGALDFDAHCLDDVAAVRDR
jgi:hypothetical protein